MVPTLGSIVASTLNGSSFGCHLYILRHLSNPLSTVFNRWLTGNNRNEVNYSPGMHPEWWAVEAFGRYKSSRHPGKFCVCLLCRSQGRFLPLQKWHFYQRWKHKLSFLTASLQSKFWLPLEWARMCDRPINAPTDDGRMTPYTSDSDYDHCLSGSFLRFLLVRLLIQNESFLPSLFSGVGQLHVRGSSDRLGWSGLHIVRTLNKTIFAFVYQWNPSFTCVSWDFSRDFALAPLKLWR